MNPKLQGVMQGMSRSLSGRCDTNKSWVIYANVYNDCVKNALNERINVYSVPQREIQFTKWNGNEIYFRFFFYSLTFFRTERFSFIVIPRSSRSVFGSW